MLLVEIALVTLSVLVAFVYPQLGSRWFEKIERRFAALARRRTLSIMVVGLAALIFRIAVLPVEPIPLPGVHDEFSYLLMADTFAHGRITNPTHPMWIHFETFHINQKPTYSSIYYPAQGLFLAFGQVFLHHPFWGVWLSAGLMCAAICWMLYGWFPAFWALLGGLLVVIRLGTFSYWVNSYFGGCVAALGGALVLGAVPRIKRHQRWQDALLMGLGLALLANSRPYEGLFFSAPVLIALVLWIFRRRGPAFRESVRHVVLPLATVLSVAAVAMLYYFWRTSGSPLRTPFFVNLATYDPVPYFPWQSVKSWPAYHHDIMRRFYSGWLLEGYEFGRQHPVIIAIIKTDIFWFFYLGPLFTVPILALAMALPRGFSIKDIAPRARFLLLVACFAFLGTLLPVFANPHYAAPMAGVTYALLLMTLQRIRHWHLRSKPVGLALVRSIPTSAVLLMIVCALAPLLRIHNNPVPQTWCSPYTQVWDRQRVLARMEELPGRHLLLVHYGLQHDVRQAWVFNHADIDGSKVVWANDMGPEQNRELIEYFKDRKTWLVQPDVFPSRIFPYSDVVARDSSITKGSLDVTDSPRATRE